LETLAALDTLALAPRRLPRTPDKTPTIFMLEYAVCQLQFGDVRGGSSGKDTGGGKKQS
jgi:hypothetical protein